MRACSWSASRSPSACASSIRRRSSTAFSTASPPGTGARRGRLQAGRPHACGSRRVHVLHVPGRRGRRRRQRGGWVCVNGMSRHARAGANANSALLVGVEPDDLPGDDVLAGVALQRELERAAFRAGRAHGARRLHRPPPKPWGDFLAHRRGDASSLVEPTYPRGVSWVDLHACLPRFVTEAMEEGLPLLDRKLRGFAHPEAVLTGVEARSSSPVRIVRDETFQARGARRRRCGGGGEVVSRGGPVPVRRGCGIRRRHHQRGGRRAARRRVGDGGFSRFRRDARCGVSLMGAFSDGVFAQVRRVPRGKMRDLRADRTADGPSALGALRRLRLAFESGARIGRRRRALPSRRLQRRQLVPGFAFGGPEVQRAMLEEEGVAFLADGRVDLCGMRVGSRVAGTRADPVRPAARLRLGAGARRVEGPRAAAVREDVPPS